MFVWARGLPYWQIKQRGATFFVLAHLWIVLWGHFFCWDRKRTITDNFKFVATYKVTEALHLRWSWSLLLPKLNKKFWFSDKYLLIFMFLTSFLIFFFFNFHCLSLSPLHLSYTSVRSFPIPKQIITWILTLGRIISSLLPRNLVVYSSRFNMCNELYSPVATAAK